MSAQEWGRKIRAYRKLRGLTQEQLAIRLGIPLTTLGNIERGNKMPSLEMLKRCSIILNVTIAEMMPKDENDS